jgi:hypothetical protein
MQRKKRGYSRETPPELMRDYKLFVIACEGGKREPGYFDVFKHFTRKIQVDIIGEQETEHHAIDKTRSAPKWVLDRVIDYIDEQGLIDEDELWFVIDTDRWPEEQLRKLHEHCNQYPNWHLALSNPCFEVWLYFHKKADITISKSASCRDFKNEISTFEKGGYDPLIFITDIERAIVNAKQADTNKTYFYPGFKTTKVYQLAEALLQKIGRREFDGFIHDKLPTMIKASRAMHKKRK